MRVHFWRDEWHSDCLDERKRMRRDNPECEGKSRSKQREEPKVITGTNEFSLGGALGVEFLLGGLTGETSNPKRHQSTSMAVHVGVDTGRTKHQPRCVARCCKSVAPMVSVRSMEP